MSGNQAHPDPPLPARNFLHFLHVFLQIITCISPSYYMYFCKMIHRFVRAHPDPFFPATRNFLHFFLFDILPRSFFCCWFISAFPRDSLHGLWPLWGGTKICINFNLGDNLTFWKSKVVQPRPFAICGAIYLISIEDVSIWSAPRYEEDHTCNSAWQKLE